MQIINVVICIPAHRYVNFDFTLNLGQLCAFTAGVSLTANGQPARVALEVIGSSSSALAQSRCRLVDRALRRSAHYALFADADHTFPPDALVRLMGLDLDVVGVNQPRRAEPTWPSAARAKPGGGWEPVYTTEEMAKNNLVEEVMNCGLAFTLVKTHVLAKMPRPHFSFETRADGSLTGEDDYFYKKVRAAGFKVHIDHALSWAMGHMDERRLTLADTLRERQAYERSVAPRSPFSIVG